MALISSQKEEKKSNFEENFFLQKSNFYPKDFFLSPIYDSIPKNRYSYCPLLRIQIKNF